MPDTVVFNTLLHACQKGGAGDAARGIFQRMGEVGVEVRTLHCSAPRCSWTWWKGWAPTQGSRSEKTLTPTQLPSVCARAPSKWLLWVSHPAPCMYDAQHGSWRSLAKPQALTRRCMRVGRWRGEASAGRGDVQHVDQRVRAKRAAGSRRGGLRGDG